MQLTRQSQIAVAIMVACARAPDQFLRTDQAAAGTGASKEHAAKIAHLLRRVGLVVSSRGRNGGIRLARPADSVTLGAVLRHTQPRLSEGANQDMPDGHAAKLASVVEAGWHGFLHLMDSFTIADLVADRPLQKRACHDCSLMQPQQVPPLSMPSVNRDVHALALHR